MAKMCNMVSERGLANKNQVLSEIDQEISNLYEYCCAAGLSHEEIQEKAKPLLYPIKKVDIKRKCFAIGNILLLVAAAGMLFASDSVQRSVLRQSRYFLFKLLPVWDWTHLYGASCFVNNPYFQDSEIVMTDCQTCEDVFEIDHLNNSTPDHISLVYLQNDVPVVITDAMADWPAMDDSFTILNITEGYLHIAEIGKQEVCMFHTNLRVQSHLKLFHRLLSEETVIRWYAHWENCQKPAEKFLRKFYNRPYFMPNVLQMTESNWLFMSSGYRGKKYKVVNPQPSITVMWVAQVRGYHYIRLEPKPPCKDVCSIIDDTIEEGEIVLFSPTLWSFSYLPGEDTENLAIAAGGFSNVVA